MSFSRGIKYPLEEGFEIVELPDGTQGKKWANGSITNAKGHIVVAAENSNRIVTREDAQEMVAKRVAKRKETIEKYVTAAVRKKTKASGAFQSDDALGVLLAKRAEVALEDNGRAGNDAAKLVLHVLEALPDQKKNEVKVTHQHELSDKTVEMLRELARLREDPDQDYLEASYVDG